MVHRTILSLRAAAQRSVLVLKNLAHAQGPIDARKSTAAFDEFFRSPAAFGRVHDLVIGAPLIALLMQQTVATAAAIAVKQIDRSHILHRMRLGLGGNRLGRLAHACDRRECDDGDQSAYGFPTHVQSIPTICGKLGSNSRCPRGPSTPAKARQPSKNSSDA